MLKILVKLIILIGFFFISPLIIISMLVVLIEDGLPVIFIQKRYGKDRKIFNIFKLRTMKKNTPNIGTHEIDESNLLLCGQYLRKFKIDELPQITNYLKGDIKPGITGLSQILGYDMSNPKKLSKVDKLYIDKKTLGLDILIFFATFFKSIRIRISDKLSEELNEINKDV